MTITFTISASGKLQLDAGQTVDFDTPLIKTSARELTQLQIAQELGIPNDKIFMYVTKIVGDAVEANEIIATKKTTFSLRQVASPISGTITQIDHEVGTISIETFSETSGVIKCFFKGVVKEVKNSDVTLEVKSSDKYKLRDVVDDFGGEVLYVERQQLADLTEEDLRNKVVFTESIKPSEAVRLDVLGARGLVTRDDIGERESVMSAELGDKNNWNDVIATKNTHCIVDKKNATMYLYSL